VFDCPKLHYNPLRQHVINREIYRLKRCHQTRVKKLRHREKIFYRPDHLTSQMQEFKSETML
jgi:hypothetical protein